MGCLAHARRKFFDALDSAPESASYVIALMRGLYDIIVVDTPSPSPIVVWVEGLHSPFVSSELCPNHILHIHV